MNPKMLTIAVILFGTASIAFAQSDETLPNEVGPQQAAPPEAPDQGALRENDAPGSGDEDAGDYNGTPDEGGEDDEGEDGGELKER